MDWTKNAAVEWADGVNEPPLSGVEVAFDHGWLHIRGQLGVRSVPQAAVKEVRWERRAATPMVERR